MSTDGIAAASLGTASEGWFDPWALLRGMRRKAIALGVAYLDEDAGVATRDGARVASVDVERVMAAASSGCSLGSSPTPPARTRAPCSSGSPRRAGAAPRCPSRRASAASSC